MYTADKIVSKVEFAQAYVGSTFDTPSDAAETYVRIAHDAVDDGMSDLNNFIRGGLEDFRIAVDSAGIGLLSDIEPLDVED